MKQGLTAFLLIGAFLAAGHAAAEDMAGNVQFLVGQAYLDDFWKPLDEPSAFGVEVDFAPRSSPVRVALAMNMSHDDATVSSPIFGKTGHVAVGTLEFSAGFLWHPVRHAVARPYLGAGVLRIFAAVDQGANAWNGGDIDPSFGFYGNAGIFFKVGDTFNIGLDGRIVRGTSVTFAGFDGNVDYGQVSLLLGFSWGESGKPPQNGSTPTNEPEDRM